MSHIDSPELTEIMKNVMTNVSFSLAALQHSDWEKGSCIFDLSARETFINRTLIYIDKLPKDCGGCIFIRWNGLAVWIKETFEFFGVDREDRFGYSFDLVVDNVMKEYHEDIRRIVTELQK